MTIVLSFLLLVFPFAVGSVMFVLGAPWWAALAVTGALFFFVMLGYSGGE